MLIFAIMLSFLFVNPSSIFAANEAPISTSKEPDLFLALHGKTLAELPTQEEQKQSICANNEEYTPLTMQCVFHLVESKSFQALLKKAKITDPYFTSPDAYSLNASLHDEFNSNCALAFIGISRVIKVAHYASLKLYAPEETLEMRALANEITHFNFIENKHFIGCLRLMQILETLGLEVVVAQKKDMLFSFNDWFTATQQGKVLLCVPSDFLDHIHDTSAHGEFFTGPCSVFSSMT